MRSKLILLLVSVGLLGGIVLSSHAATISVTNTGDSGSGSLRNAIASAANSGDTIDFNLAGCPCTITLTSGQIAINKSLTINGLGANLLTISGNNSSRVFSIGGGVNVVTINDLTIAGGRATTEGGGIVNSSILTINSSVIRNNTTTFIAGGGIYNIGALTLRNSVVSGNSASGNGGGIYVESGQPTDIANTNFLNNTAVADGGGLYVMSGVVNVGGGNFQGNMAANGGAIVNRGSLNVNGANIELNQAVNGGGIYNGLGTLTLSQITIQSNTATGDGGGIYNFNNMNSANLVITNGSLIASNQAANGGGIFNNSSVTVSNSTISGNTATVAGGGIHNKFNVTATGITLNGNGAARGGGIFSDHFVSLTNSTLSGNQATGNTAPDGGGAIYNAFNPTFDSTVIFLNATIAGNTSVLRGGGIRNVGFLIASKNTIFAQNTAPTAPDFDGILNNSLGFNLIGNTSGGSGFIASDLQNVNPNLGALADNGGLTQTRALLAGSPAINAGTNTGAPLTDQRGLSRPMGGTTDIGAYEVNVCGNALVSNTNDSGIGSLRCAISAVLNDGVVNFNLPAGSTITLSSEIVIDKPVFIDGTGINNLTISGGGAVRAFTINAPVSINGLIIANGRALNGGAILNNSNLTVNECALTGNNTDNLGVGGAIANNDGATVKILSSTLSGNSSSAGGAIFNSSGATAEIVNSALSGNSASQGGAIFNSGTARTSGTIRVINSTISGNTASGGGGIYNATLDAQQADKTLIINATIAGNTGDGGGINGIATIKNTIIATNTGARPDVFGAFVSQGFNLIGNTTGGSGFIATDLLNVNPNLGALANNGGLTQTRALLPGSPAIDKGGAADIPLNFFQKTQKNNARTNSLVLLDTDQRGATRPIDSPQIPNAVGGDGSDIGAFEVQTPTAASVSISGGIFTSDGRGLRNALVILTDSVGNTRTIRSNTFGYYRFDEVAVGEIYTIQVVSKQASFTPQIVSVLEELTELNFTAQSSP